MSTPQDETLCTRLFPASLPPELSARFLSAMQAATAAEETPDEEDSLEQRLRHLSPAPVGEGRQRAWLSQMQAARRPRRMAWRVLYRWSAAAALFVLCTSGSILMMNSRASATVTSGLACRSLMETRTDGQLQWHEGQTALRTCEVLYEDSFVLDGDEGSTITVRVPVRTQLMLEEEVI